MKTLQKGELTALASKHFPPESLDQYIKSLLLLGTLECNAKSLIAGHWARLVVGYTVGGSGVADGARIKRAYVFAERLGCPGSRQAYEDI